MRESKHGRTRHGNGDFSGFAANRGGFDPVASAAIVGASLAFPLQAFPLQESRITPLLGAGLVAYLVADIASAGPNLDVFAVAVAAIATLLALAPVLVRKDASPRDARRTGALGVAAGLLLVTFVQPTTRTLGVEIFRAAAPAILGALALELALDMPDAPRAYARRGLKVLVRLAAGVALALGGLAVAPASEAGFPVVPHRWLIAPFLFAAIAFGAAFVLHAMRRRFGSSPEALASAVWAKIGLLCADVAMWLGIAWIALRSGGIDAVWLRAVAVLGATSLVVGHLRAIDDSWRTRAGPTARRALSAAITLGAVGLGGFFTVPAWARDPWAAAIGLPAALLFASVLHRFVQRLALRALSPAGGALVRATEQAHARLDGAGSTEEVARAVLVPLREASGSPEGEALLFQLSPPKAARVDAAGEPHVEDRNVPEPLRAQAFSNLGEIIDREALEAMRVRRPETRALLESLAELGARAAVPLVRAGELEGILIVPKGRRRGPLAYEERLALDALAAKLAAQLTLLGAIERARLRESEAVVRDRRHADEIDTLRAELERLERDRRVRAESGPAEPRAASHVAYGPAMRAVHARLDAIAPTGSPIALIGELGVPLESLARQIHAASGRAHAPFVVVDAADVRPEHTEAALFGTGGPAPMTGWADRASDGTLVVLNAPALSQAAQRGLTEALATKEGRRANGGPVYPWACRVVCTARVSLASLVAADLFDAELASRLVSVDVPPLRARREDIPSLVLLALDRASRALGRPVIGIEKDALDALLRYAWPANALELETVLDRAVAQATSTKVTLRDLPPLASPDDETGDPLAGPYDAIERRIILHALAQANGNKTEAARLLDLKRSTFLDKLRRHQRTDPTA